MRNFDCVPPVMQINVQISILSSFINYLRISMSFYHNHYREQAVTHSIIRKVLPAKHQQSGQVSNIIRWHLIATHHHKVHTTNK
jgi:hypothetical protein